MIRAHFLTEEDRNKLIALARDGSVASRVTRRANALVLLDDGWSCQEVAAALLLNDDTIRGWFKLFEQRGIEGLTSFDMGGSASFLSAAQEDALKVFVSATLPRSTRQVGAWIEQEFGLVYESRSGRGRAVRGRGASDPCGAACRLLGAKTREARDRTDERARSDQYSRRDRPRDRTDPDDRGRNCRRHLDDQALGIDRGALSVVGAHPCLS